MPIHDWTRVTAGTFHDFHAAWLAEIRTALNTGVLPEDFYAQAEQVAGEVNPDVLTLQAGNTGSGDGPFGATAVADAPPRMRLRVEAEAKHYLAVQDGKLVVVYEPSEQNLTF